MNARDATEVTVVSIKNSFMNIGGLGLEDVTTRKVLVECL